MDAPLRLLDRVVTGIELGESHFREFKSALDGPRNGAPRRRDVRSICRDIAEVLVAFANADGGELLVGVEDDGEVTGVPHSDQDLVVLRDAPRTHVHAETPLSPPSVSTLTINDRQILYFRIAKSTTQVHLTSDGRCLRRFDRENRPVPAEHIQYARREVESREYDRQFVPLATVQDLDTKMLTSIADQLAPGYSAEKLLQFLDLAAFSADGLQVRRAALLLFARDIVKWHPRCELRILRVDGTELKTAPQFNVAQDDTVSGNIITILEEGWETLRPHLARTRFQAQGLFRESVIYPEDACRETVINAVAHRDYSAEGEPIQILVFDDRMEVRSPGGLLSSVLLQDLKQLKGAHQSRNVFVARVLRELGYMREIGEGLRRIFASMKKADLVEPDLASDSSRFTVTLFYKSVFSPKDLEWLEGFADFDLSKDEQRVVLAARDGHLLSTAGIIELLKIVDTEDFRAMYERLNKKGIIYSTTRTKTRRRRNLPRFRIRPPQEAQQYLAELQNALRVVGPVADFSQPISERLRARLSSESPYISEPAWALQALGYSDGSKHPLPRANALWQAEGASRDEPDDGRLTGIVVSVGIKDFGFAITPDGEKFFIHASEMVQPDHWLSIREGTVLEFWRGQRSISGKAHPARKISVKVAATRAVPSRVREGC